MANVLYIGQSAQKDIFAKKKKTTGEQLTEIFYHYHNFVTWLFFLQIAISQSIVFFLQNSFQIGVSIVGDHLSIIYGQPGHWRFTRVGNNLTDGIWYHLNITIKSGTITIQIDGVSKSVMVPSVNHIDQEIYFGEASANFSDLSQALRGPVFTGCIRQLSLNNETVALESGQTFGTNPLPKPGCTVDQRCSSNICGYRGTCKTTWNSTECKCDVGYQGDRCQNGK